MTQERLTLGSWGEKQAARFLKKKRFRILERNYRCPLGEIDIIARRKDVLIFVEVKTRYYNDHFPPQFSVNRRKQRQIIRTAQYYLKQNHISNQSCRFDVVAVTAGEGKKPEKIEHFPGAFRL